MNLKIQFLILYFIVEKQCRRCIKECPLGAIYENAIEQEAGRFTHIDNEKCFPHFGNNYGCTVCIKVCPVGRD